MIRPLRIWIASSASMDTRLVVESYEQEEYLLFSGFDDADASLDHEKLEKWADDMVLSAEKALVDTKEQIKALRRQARQAVTL